MSQKRTLSRIRRSFVADQSGSIVLIAAAAIPVIIGFSALAVDVGMFYATKTQMQQATDFAGISTMSQIRSHTESQNSEVTPERAAASLTNHAVEAAKANLPDAGAQVVLPGDVTFGVWDFKTESFDASAKAEQVNAVRIRAERSTSRSNAVGTLFGQFYLPSIGVQTDSLAVLPQTYEFYVLSKDADGALEVNDSDIDINSIIVNSDSSAAFRFTGFSGDFGVGIVDVRGGVTGISKNQITTGVEGQSDILAEFSEPASSSCDYTNPIVINSTSPALRPGVYCDTVTIENDGDVTLGSGVYVFKDARLEIKNTTQNATVWGQNVLLHFTGKASGLSVEGGRLQLEAAVSGPWRGVVMSSARGTRAPERLVISNTTTFLNGTMYFPDSKLEVTATKWNGLCATVCVVADQLLMENETRVNYYSYRSTSSGWQQDLNGNSAKIPRNPVAFEQAYRPYIIAEQK